MAARCCVPFCRRTWKAGDPAAEWLCWQHWKAIPINERRVFHRAYLDAKPESLTNWKKPPRWLMNRRKRELPGIALKIYRVRRLWARMKRLAIARASLESFE